MNTFSLLRLGFGGRGIAVQAFIVCLSVQWLHADAARTGSLQVTERGPHHRVWNTTRAEIQPDGSSILRTNSYVELANGLNYFADGEWRTTKEAFQIVDGGAVATEGPHKIALNANIAAVPAVTIDNPDGTRLKTRILGLAYYDAESGKSVLIAETKDCTGEIVAPNQILYRDAFTDVSADVRCIYTMSGFESDVILREQLPSPKEWGLNVETVRIQVWHEMLEAPAPQKRTSILSGEADSNKRGGMVDPDVKDEYLDFGAMHIGPGKAFAVGAEADRADIEGIPVGKTWGSTPDQRQFLIESISYQQINLVAKSVFEKLGAKASRPKQNAALAAVRKRAVASNQFLASLPKSQSDAHSEHRAIMIAAAPKTSEPGIVLDYTTVNVNKTNFVFRSDTTYYISGPVTLAGSGATNATIFESGTVIKFAPTNSAKLTLVSPISWQGEPYRPVVLTARDDHTIGEKIGTNTLSGFYADVALSINANTAGTNATLQNLRIAHAKTAIELTGRAGHLIQHAQFVNCQNGIKPVGADFAIRNALFHGVMTNFNGSASTGRCEHLTVHVSDWMNYNNTCPQLFLTNCLLVAVTNTGTFISNSVERLSSSAGVFQAVGAGYHYLATNSLRNIGTTNTSLWPTLAKLTTFPPVVITNHFLRDTTLAPQAERDAQMPDIGYHYWPADYAWSSMEVASATVVLTNGVIVLNYGDKGSILKNGSKFVSQGSPLAMNRIVRHPAVQEQPVLWGNTNNLKALLEIAGNAPLPEVTLNCTELSVMGEGQPSYLIYCNSLSSRIGLRDSMLQSGHLYVVNNAPSETIRLEVTNSLLFRVGGYISQGNYPSVAPLHFLAKNNLFYGSASFSVIYRYFTCYYCDTWSLKDNLFDSMALWNYGDAIPASYNAWHNTAPSTFPGTGNITLSYYPGYGLEYRAGPLGKFYYPATGSQLSQLINAGSGNATAAGLYHYTVTTNQVKETNSTVDIGLHYAATEATGLLADADKDTLSDWLEDPNGNGSKDADETDFALSDTDYDGRSDGDEITDGTNPLDAASALPVLLGSWPFNNAQFSGDQGQVPLICTNLQWITEPTYDAAQIDTNNSAQLCYAEHQLQGRPNINLRNGLVRFLYKPNWTSASRGGSGPGVAARLIEVGTESPAASGQWTICVSPDGNQVMLCTASNGVAMTNLTGTIKWAVNEWADVMVSYTPTNSALYTNGVQSAVGTGITRYPSASVRQNGFRVGSDENGSRQAKGQVESLETYNSPLVSAGCACGPAQSCQKVPNCSSLPGCNNPNWTILQYPAISALPPNPEPGTIGEIRKVLITTARFPGLLCRTVQCSTPTGGPIDRGQYADWPITSEAIQWFAPGATPSSGTGNGAVVQITSADAQVNFIVTGSAMCPAPPPSFPIQAGTFAAIPSLPATRLGAWDFNDAYLSQEGFSPIETVAVTYEPTWSGKGVRMIAGRKLIYPAFDSSGMPTIKRNLGTVRFWFKPEWTTGGGPGTAARLLEIQGESPWSLRLNSAGTLIELYSGAGATPSLSFSRPINWTAGQWYQVTVIYFQRVAPFDNAGLSEIYINGAVLRNGTPNGASGGGVTEAQNRMSSFSVGSDATGGNSAKGVFDRLETFNYPLAEAAIVTEYNTVISLDSDGDGLTDFAEHTIGTDRYEPDTDGDGVSDGADAFPLDPLRSTPTPSTNPGDTIPPGIELQNPTGQ